MNRGASRTSRVNKALSPDYIKLDERSMMDMVNMTLDYAETINYFNYRDKPEGDWKSFFLKDPIFIIAIISGTNIKKHKETHDILIANTSIKSEKDETGISENFIELQRKVRNWKDLLTESDYNGVLVQEVKKLDESINDKFPLSEFTNEELNSKKETLGKSDEFNNIYAKTLHFKEAVVKKFKDEVTVEYNHLPHIGLILTFYKLFHFAQLDINQLTKKHLDYYYRNLLQEKQNFQNYQSHTAMISCKLKKEVKSLIIDKDAVFDFDFGGGYEGEFMATSATQINKAVITDVKTIYKKKYEPFESRDGQDSFYYEMLFETDVLKKMDSLNEYRVNSMEDYPMTFGEENKNYCDLGFIISSESLLLEQGHQVINLEFKLVKDPFKNEDDISKPNKNPFSRLVDKEFELYLEKCEESNKLKAKKGLQIEVLTEKEKKNRKEKLKKIIEKKFFEQAFNIYITNKEGWKPVSYMRKTQEPNNHDVFSISIPLNDIEDQFVSFDPAIHDGNYDTDWPCIKVLLNNEATYHPYVVLNDLALEYILIKSVVSRVSQLKLSNSNGEIDNSIPFAPFGALPEVSSYLRIQNPLIFQKNLTSLELEISWNGLPQLREGFKSYYKEYESGITNESFKAFIAQNRNLDRNTSISKNMEFDLFETDTHNYLKNIRKKEVDLNNFELNNKILQIDGEVVENPTSIYVLLKSPAIGFGHGIFSQVYAKAAMQNAQFFKKSVPLPKPPYTPLIDQLTVNYTNTVKENVLRKEDEDTASIKFIHVYPFGHVKTFPGSVKSPFFLLPQIDKKGSLFLGIEDVIPNEIVSIGLDLIPAVNFNTVVKKPKIKWKYLNNNNWVNLIDHVLEDGTNGFIRSGIIKLEIPSTIQMNNTRTASGKFWIKAEYNGYDLNSRIKNIFTQAISVRSETFLPNSIFSDKLVKKSVKINPLGNKKIDKILGPVDFVTINNSTNDTEYYTLVSEQLRHKNRGITNWDIERIVLEKFRQVEKVRVYGRNNYPKELVQGSTTQIVVIPAMIKEDISLFQANKFDIDTLLEIKKYIMKFVSPFVKVEVCNAVFEELKVRCRIQFTDALKGPTLKIKLNQELIKFLSPNVLDFDDDSLFEKSFTKSEIYSFIKARPYVKKIIKFSVIQLINVNEKHRIIDTEDEEDLQNNTRWHLRTISAYAILTSVPLHHIEIFRSQPDEDKIKGIGDIAIGSDFIITKETDGRNIYIED